MNTEPLVVTPAVRQQPLSVVGTEVIVLTSLAESGGAQITLQSGAEGMGPPPHSHAWAESFYVTRGEVRFTCGGATTACGAGTLVHVPPGAIHSFCYGPGGGEMLELTGRESRAIDMFTAMDHELPPGPPDVPRVVQIASRYGCQFHL